ncbi:MAG: NHL repeat-containing protein, partial [Ghiorsea sp.]|nr:NHL repeat-containing protein [Ghiorsea sp.]
MRDIIKQLNQQLRISFTVGLSLLITTPVQAAPTLVDSISSAQLTGIASDNISSLYAKHGTVWVTDQSQIAYQWQTGEAPTVFQKGNEKQAFSSLMPISKQRFVLTDANQSLFLVSAENGWHSFAKEGSQEGQIDEPIAAAWSNHGIIYIAEAGNDRISAFTPEGLFLFTLGDTEGKTTADLNLKDITHLAVDRKGRVYILDKTNGGRISIYSDQGELDTILGQGEFILLGYNNPRLTAMTVRPDGVLIVAEKKSGHILEIDWENMKISSSFGTNGKGRGQFKSVSSLALDTDGKLYVADQGNQKIEIFQLDWQDRSPLNTEPDPMSVLPSSVLLSACDKSYIYGAEQILCINTKEDSVSIRSHDDVVLQQLNSKFDTPIRAVFDQHELLILDDDGVKVFDRAGKFKFAFASKGRSDGDISDASGLTLSANAVFIADTGNQRIQIYSRNGLFKRTIGQNKKDVVTLKEPTAIAIANNQNIYVADAELKQILVYSHAGKLIKQLGYPKEHRHEFLTIHDLMTTQGNMLYAMVSTANNPLAVWVYHNDQYAYRFSPNTLQAKAGYDKQWSTQPSSKPADTVAQLKENAKKELQSTVDISLDLTTKPDSSFFSVTSSLFSSGDTWIFNPILNKPHVITILDTAKHVRHTFIALFPPKKVRNISITGDEKQAHIQWLETSSHFTGYYNVYARKDISLPFQLIQQTLQPQITLDRETSDFTEYRISASTPLGKNSVLSAIYQDIFLLGYRAFMAHDYEHALDLLSEATLANPKH